MGAFFETLPPSLVDWLLAQKVFWIASAPLSGSGHVNVSPKGVADKGGPFFGIIREPAASAPASASTTPSTAAPAANDGTVASGEVEKYSKAAKKEVIKKFWYMDLTGSGIETTSHLHEPGNGRITVLFNAFDGPPRIVRLFGKGTPLEYGTPAFNAICKSEGIIPIAGTRSIIMVDITQVGTSCGFSVPYYDFTGFRSTLHDFMEKRVASDEAGNRKDGMEVYWAFKNAWSMDGLPGLLRAVETGKTEQVKPMKKMVGKAGADYQKKIELQGQGMGSLGVKRVFGLNEVVLVALVSALVTAVSVVFILRQLGLEGVGQRTIWIRDGCDYGNDTRV